MIRQRHKFNAVRCESDGVKFASKAEKSFYLKLKILQNAGEVLFFLMQVPLRLPGGTRYICDFVIFDSAGEVRFVDVKGMETDVFKIKKREIEAIYPITIEIQK